ncbi:hypothetical protein ACIBTV_27880 [Micromonospora sp. NPDC049366]|uniref:hypothetical protein n=1 Tax=Micromonospora sp. NPDC049366 TaxID=3364271 RepID=UPI0037898F07
MARANENKVDETKPAPSPLEPTAVQAAKEADRRDDLPNADTDTKQAEKDAK